MVYGAQRNINDNLNLLHIGPLDFRKGVAYS
jgi:hypothetical protein